MYTIKQLSTLAGVTPHTLRHYDQIGLLKPETIGENRGRDYDYKKNPVAITVATGTFFWVGFMRRRYGT